MQQKPEPLLQFNNVSIGHHNQIILSNITFSLQLQEKVVLTGPTGSGKSTLLLTLLGRYPIKSGCITFMGTSLTPQSASLFRQQIAFIQQEPVFQDATVEVCLKTPLRFKSNQDISISNQEWHSYLNHFKLPIDYMQKPVSILSGGEKQKIACIRAIALRRPLILSDEPSSAQDKSGSYQVAQLFIQRKAAVFAISHDDHFTKHFTRVLEISNGTIRESP